MKTCYYYAFNDKETFGSINACSLSSAEYPLVVNCAGRTVTDRCFTTDNLGGREDYYLIYIERGNMQFTLNGVSRKAGSGDMVIFPPRYHYRYSFDGGDTLSYLWVHFTGSYAGRLLGECGFDSLPCICKTRLDVRIVSSFNRMFEIFEEKVGLQNQRLACTLEELILNAAISLCSDTESRTLGRSLAHIHSSYGTDIRIPDLAKMESLSNSRYINVFKERTGLSPSEYLINLRMNVACELLKNSDMSVKQIAVSVGYGDAHFFSKLFKKKTGVSPREYRNC